MILLSGTIDVDHDQREAFIEPARTLQSKTREEAGCEGYAFTAALDDPGRFYVSERWSDEDAVASHAAAPHMADFFAAVGGLVRGADITKYTGATGEKFM